MSTDESVKKLLTERAGSCLDHVLLVRWGQAVSKYTVIHDGLVIEFDVSVKCFDRADETQRDP